MTEPYNNPFGAVANDAPDTTEQDAGSRRKLVALGGLTAVLLAGGAYVLLSGGEEVTEAAAVPSASRAVSPAVVAPPKAVKLPVATQVQLGRNPFRALYVQPPPPPPPPVTPTTVEQPPSTPTVVGGSGPGSVPAPAPAQPVAAKPPTKEYRLVLTRVYGTGKDQTAVFTIDGRQQTARVGSNFGPTAEIKLLSLKAGPKADEHTAVLQVGDGDPFDVATGESAFVR